MEPVSLFYEKRAQLLLKNLRARHFDACYCPNRTSALAAALRLIPQGSLVGWGGARSADQIGLQQALRDGPWRVIDRESMQTGAQRAYSQRREPPVSTPNIAPLPPQCARRRQVAAQAPDRNRRASRTG